MSWVLVAVAGWLVVAEDVPPRPADEAFFAVAAAQDVITGTTGDRVVPTSRADDVRLESVGG